MDPALSLSNPEDGEDEQQEERDRTVHSRDSLLPRSGSLFPTSAATPAATAPVMGDNSSDNHCQFQCPATKRRLPFSQDQNLPPEEPMVKRQLLLDQQQDIDFALRGYTKIVLPSPEKPPAPFSASPSKWSSSSSFSQHCCSPSASRLPPLPPLRRTVSDPVPVITSSLEGSPHSSTSMGFSPSPPAPIPVIPPPQPLRRTVSDPSPAIMSSVQESPDSRRLRRMTRGLKELNRWCQNVLHELEVEEQEEPSEPEEKSNVSEDGVNAETECEETVSAEMVGDCLSVQFRCACSKRFQILLSGKKCFYKLI